MPRLYFVLIAGLGNKSSSAPPQRAQRYDEGGAQITCPSCSQAITGATSTCKAHFHKPRGAYGVTKSDGNPNYGLKGWDPLSRPPPPWAVPGQPQPHRPGVKAITMSNAREPLGLRARGPEGMGHINGIPRKSIWKLCGTYIGCLERNQRQGKGGSRCSREE